MKTTLIIAFITVGMLTLGVFAVGQGNRRHLSGPGGNHETSEGDSLVIMPGKNETETPEGHLIKMYDSEHAEEWRARGDSLCLERGHVLGSIGFRTGMLCYSRIIDLPDRTLIVRIDENTETLYCLRCGKKITRPVQVKPDTTVIWRKGETP